MSIVCSRLLCLAVAGFCVIVRTSCVYRLIHDISAYHHDRMFFSGILPYRSSVQECGIVYVIRSIHCFCHCSALACAFVFATRALYWELFDRCPAMIFFIQIIV